MPANSDESTASHDHAERARRALGRVGHFGELPPRVQAAIAANTQPRRFAAGQVIYLEGEPAGALYILEAGWVKAVRLSAEGREQVLLAAGPGEVFGDVAVFAGTPYPATVVALEDVTAWTIEQSAALALVAQHPELALAVIRRLSQRVLYYVGLVEDLSLRSVEARLAHTLLSRAGEYDGRLVVQRRGWATFDEIASRLGTVRDVLSRALRTLESEGLLRVERTAIVILDASGLAARGQPTPSSPGKNGADAHGATRPDSSGDEPRSRQR
jgi:CRP/FNR family transcriptional regulator